MKRNKKTIAHARRIGLKSAGLAIIFVLALTACDKKDTSEYYHLTENPNSPEQPPIEKPGQVVAIPPVIPSAPGEPEQPAPPAAPIVIVDKDGNAQEIAPGQPTDVESGTYVMTTVTTPAGPADLPSGEIMTPATATTPGSVTIAPSSSGTSSEGDGSIGILPPLPEILAGSKTMTVSPNGVTTSAIELVHMTREVVIEGVLQGLDPSVLSSAVFTLEGVLNTRSMDEPFAAATGAISRGSAIGSSTGAISRGAGTRAASIYAAQTTFTIDAQGNFTARVRLLGIDSAAAQRLVLTLTYKDTTVPPYVYSNDVSSVLAGFNAGATNQPAHLQALLSFGLDGITGTINGWMPAPPEDLPGE